MKPLYYMTRGSKFRIVRHVTSGKKVKYEVQECHGADIWWYRAEYKKLKSAEKDINRRLKNNIIKSEVVYEVESLAKN
jgi:hypothetical protein